MTARDYRPIPPEVRAAIISDYETKHMTYRAMAEKYGYRIERIQSILRGGRRNPGSSMYGASGKGRAVGEFAPQLAMGGEESKAISREMAEMHKTMTYEAIGEHFGVSRTAVYLRLLRMERPVRHIPCSDCGEMVPYGGMVDHRKANHPWQKVEKSAYRSIEHEMRAESIARAYREGTRIKDISLTYRTGDGKPMTYSQLYATLRKEGIEPSRGGGSYRRDAAALERLSKSQRLRAKGVKMPQHGWRALEDG